MRRELQQKLFEKYPDLYRLRIAKEGEPLEPIVFGIECEDGWFDLIDRLSQQVVSLDPEATVVQVKEKFGGLRFYLNGSHDAWEASMKAEEESYTICEACGKPGTLRDNDRFYIQTLCDEHAKEESSPSY